MKKRILAVLIATALAVSVTGCAGNATSSSDSTSASSVAESSDTSTQTSSDASSEDESKNENSQEESKDLEANYTKYTLDGDLTQHMIDISRLNICPYKGKTCKEDTGDAGASWNHMRGNER